ncbi:MAG: hypothetical protein M1826_004980 [Phylliscum demangeonii]|nr:MAG: hypothetical protein M1826_004980 [Phylliscum demangeonii]
MSPSRGRMPPLPRVPIFQAMARHRGQRTAIISPASSSAGDPSPCTYSYRRLLRDASHGSQRLARLIPHDRARRRPRIAFLVEQGYQHVVSLLSILGAHAIAVPLPAAFPAPELRHMLNDSGAAVLLASRACAAQAEDVCREGLGQRPRLVVCMAGGGGRRRRVYARPGGMTAVGGGGGGVLLYTSGTTSRPKGVLLSHTALTAQCRSLRRAWQYTAADQLLHVLPLHHIHGLVNGLLAPLHAGACVEFLAAAAPAFNPTAVWTRLAASFLLPPPVVDDGDGDGGAMDNKAVPPTPARRPISIFTAVPTIYSRLLATFGALPPAIQAAARTAIAPAHLRLNMCGSAALPAPTRTAWTALSAGNVLLERYGMTEVGMALSGGLDVRDRVEGCVGWPMPGVEVRLVQAERGDTDADGELQIRGPTVFAGYWNNAAATEAAFVHNDDDDGGGGGGKGRWFKTGDIATALPPAAGASSAARRRGPMYCLRGRLSVDIIKTGGEKVSALEVERELLALPQIAEAAVVGIDAGSSIWGQRVAALVVVVVGGNDPDAAPAPTAAITPLSIRRALRDRLAAYKIPVEIQIVPGPGLARNAMGKVNKKDLIARYFPGRE